MGCLKGENKMRTKIPKKKQFDDSIEDMKRVKFYPEKAISGLEKNRKDYVMLALERINLCVSHGNYEMASNYIVAAADNLKELNGSLNYLHAITRSENEDDYPEFKTIFD